VAAAVGMLDERRSALRSRPHDTSGVMGATSAARVSIPNEIMTGEIRRESLENRSIVNGKILYRLSCQLNHKNRSYRRRCQTQG
jgi:hypothetical protein